jgi:BirA family transcriptional regulator, biotin operon repressor / biotin---[acetyl-CoA-carboxylase] ligase
MHAAAENIWQAVQTAYAERLAHFSVEVLPSIDSTNTELMRRAHAGRTEPTLLVALQQSAGRGRLGRQWASTEGDSLTFSLGIALAPQDWQGLSLAVGLAVAQALHADIAIKWPNDLWWQGRKLAGILVETASMDSAASVGSSSSTSPTSSPARYCVVGIGINIRTPPADGMRTPPVGLEELATAPSSAGQALESIALPLLRAVLAFEQQGFAPVQAAYNARDALRGHHVRAEQANALQAPAEGVARGVDRVGALLVHTALGVQKISSSEVSIRPVAQPVPASV